MTPSLPPADRAVLFGLCLAAFLSMAAMRACDPLLPAFAATFGAGTGAVALTISGFAIAYGLLQLVYGPLADRYGKLRVIAVAVSACTLGSTACALAWSLDALVAARMASGAAAAGIIPLALAWVGDAVAYARRQEVLAQLMTATLLGTAFGQWSAGLLADTLGWRVVFVLLACAFLALAWRLWRMPRAVAPPSRHEGRFLAGILAVLRKPWARTVLGVTAIEGAFAFSVAVFVPTYLHARFGLSLRDAALIVALFAIGGLVYALQARVLVARLGEAGMVALGAALLALAFCVIGWAAHWLPAVPASLAAGFGFSMLHATLQTHATQMAPEARGTAVSLFGASLFFGQSAGVALAASVVDRWGFGVIFGTAAAVIATLGLGFARTLAVRRQA